MMIHGGNPMRVKFAITIITLAMLCISVLGQENTASYWNGEGINLAKSGQYVKAIECFDQAIELDPNLAAAWTNKGGFRLT